MRYFKYHEPREDGTDREVIMSVADVKNDYYPFWKEQVMQKDKNADISFERCLDDWIAVNWAYGIGKEIAENPKQNRPE